MMSLPLGHSKVGALKARRPLAGGQLQLKPKIPSWLARCQPNQSMTAPRQPLTVAAGKLTQQKANVSRKTVSGSSSRRKLPLHRQKAGRPAQVTMDPLVICAPCPIDCRTLHEAASADVSYDCMTLGTDWFWLLDSKNAFLCWRP